MIRRPPRSTQSRSSAASDVYKRQVHGESKFYRVASPILKIYNIPTQTMQPASQLKEDQRFILKLVDKEDHILLVRKVGKFNFKSKRQERYLVITDKGVYNVVEEGFLQSTLSFLNITPMVRRKILLQKIAGIIISQEGQEFVLNVPDEYDYRFDSENKEEIVIAVHKAIHAIDSKRRIAVHIKPDLTLDRYTTTKEDAKSGVKRTPRDPPEYFTDEEFENRITQMGKKRESNLLRTETIMPGPEGKNEKITLNDFNLLKVLGRGAFGKVMLVEKKDTKQLYAMKSLVKASIIEKEQLEHTKTERYVLENAKHPFLVNLEWAFQTPDKIFFVMKFMRGGELFQHLRQVRRFPEERAKFYAAEVLLALEHLHSKDIIYRDLKPENILMDELGHVYLTDFGMAKYVQGDNLAQSLVGTAEYLAPEVIRCEGHSKPADWWGLGILIFEMVYGIPPFYNQNQDMMFELIQRASLKFPNRADIIVSPLAQDLITKLLNKNPATRLGTKGDGAEIRQHPWFETLDFERLLRKEPTPPFKPKLTSEYDTDNFDPEYTKEVPINSVAVSNMGNYKGFDSDFKDFDYAPAKQGGDMHTVLNGYELHTQRIIHKRFICCKDTLIIRVCEYGNGR
eukprot:TRINITY_DN2770_c0_g1_i10.p1 TRINITY_DN2770_c0_g1~~TRINITY_DN2770_c0_g1_i10.p1  ORF type:complete len:624 (-),score=179.59 TRINITY_DN2770_c0_g1_i10:979-2850(-)